MFKTCISVAAVGKAPDIVKNMIDRMGWPIATIVIELDRVSYYVCYKWYDYFYVNKIKREIRKCEERSQYYYKPDIYSSIFSEAEKRYIEEDRKATTRLVCEAIQKDPKYKNIEAIVNDDGIVIGCKIKMFDGVRG